MSSARCLCFCLGLCVLTAGAWAQPAASDPEVLKGISLVEEGENDAAIFTLDTAVRRLAADPTKTGELSQAYLYLGIAYFGKGHEAAAKAKFREAVKQFSGISLSAEQYPPTIIDLFEAAKAAEENASTVAAPEEKKGGSKKPLILLGVGGAAAAGIAVAAGGGGGSEETEPTMQTVGFSGTLTTPDDYDRGYTLYVQGSGVLEATVTWTSETNDSLGMRLWAGEPWSAEAPEPVAESNRTSDTSAQIQFQVSPRNYVVDLFMHWRDECHDGTLTCTVSFELTVRHP